MEIVFRFPAGTIALCYLQIVRAETGAQIVVTKDVLLDKAAGK
jgi:hypothetical protein